MAHVIIVLFDSMCHFLTNIEDIFFYSLFMSKDILRQINHFGKIHQNLTK